MGFWNKQETELHLSIGSDPSKMAVYTNWPYYVTRLAKCDGFTAEYSYSPSEGGKLVHGVVDQGDYKFIWMRKDFGSDSAREEFEQEKAKLDEVIRDEAAFKLAAHERETHFMATADEPYWMSVETDSAVWQRRLSNHLCAVLVQETRYDDDEEGSPSMYQRYMFPRALITVRGSRPKYSDEHRQALRDRLASFKD